MSRARARAVALVIALLVAAAVAMAVLGRGPGRLPPRAPGDRPTLLLLTSLPLVFSEQFSLAGGGSPALSALEARYHVVPISVADETELSKGRLLLMAHPSAQPAEDLVALDDWVRRGGRVLLLADPMLEWPSSRPLGDPLRPSPMFMDTGLLTHWGLRLDAPDRRGLRMEKMGDFQVLTASPGTLSGRCDIASNGFVARCRLGAGRAIVVADADILNVETDRRAAQNLDALLAELASLERG